ncbi:MAG: T9SS type A sorting domain-containing protein [Flavobacteriales bacterium]|nr:T9SS type A sorting domain-containing protein [Flavobacteriales bacterium]
MALSLHAEAQNLVPNGNFNLPDMCTPQSFPDPGEIEPWFRTFSSPSSFHPCFPQSHSVPFNLGGGGQPVEGEGYMGLYTYAESTLLREFMSVELTEDLVEGISYHTAFHVSRMDSSWYATKDIGMLFTEDVPESNLAYLLNVEPQVKHEVDTFLTDIHDWTRIEDSFIANGGERYLTLGNFSNDEETDTLFVPGGGAFRPGSPDFWSTAYYYVDAVSVIPDSIYLGVRDFEEENVSLGFYPNPVTQTVTMEVEKWRGMVVSIVDMTGREVLWAELHASEQRFGVGQLPKGVYVVVLKREGTTVARRKLVKQ